MPNPIRNDCLGCATLRLNIIGRCGSSDRHSYRQQGFEPRLVRTGRSNLAAFGQQPANRLVHYAAIAHDEAKEVADRRAS